MVSKEPERSRLSVAVLKEAAEDSDAGLVEEFRAGDASAFDELVRRYKDRVYNVVYRYVGNHEDAMDAAQEVFIRAYRGIHTFKGHARVYTWLYSIAANVSRNRLRDMGRKGRNRGASLDAMRESDPAGAERAASTGATPAAAAERAELDDALKACLDDLPDSYRMTFVLRTFDDLPYEEIAAACGCPQGTIKSRLNQARRRLRDCLKARGVL